jgi:hypothetical protein
MLSRINLLTITVLAVSALGVGQAAAQQPSADQMTAAYQAARNQYGILQYCQSSGFADADAVAIQEKLVGLIPVADKTTGDDAEALGKKGTVSAMGVNTDLEAAAKAQGTTVQQFCTTIAAAIKQAGAQLPK